MEKIVICICTRARPKMLEECLRAVINEDWPANAVIRHVVVDNSEFSDEMWESTYLRRRAITPEVRKAISNAVGRNGVDYTIQAIREPELGISQARNTALEEALDMGADWIVFIDDDEVPERGWLGKLYEAAQEHNADAVHGVIRYRFPEDAPRWRCRKPWGDWGDKEGMELDSAGTGNVIFRASIVRNAGIRFDESRGFIGGEDARFFRTFHEAGGRIVLSLKPVVYETVPWSRITTRAHIKKSFRAGVSKVENRLMNGKRTRVSKALTRMAVGIGKILGFVMIIPFSEVRGFHTGLSGLRCLAEGAGMLWSISGRNFQYYKHVTGE